MRQPLQTYVFSCHPITWHVPIPECSCSSVSVKCMNLICWRCVNTGWAKSHATLRINCLMEFYLQTSHPKLTARIRCDVTFGPSCTLCIQKWTYIANRPTAGSNAEGAANAKSYRRNKAISKFWSLSLMILTWGTVPVRAPSLVRTFRVRVADALHSRVAGRIALGVLEPNGS